MNLQEMVSQVHRLSDNGVVVEFDNHVSVVYEKDGSSNPQVLSAELNAHLSLKQERLLSGDVMDDERCSFSDELYKSVFEANVKYNYFQRETGSRFGALVEELGITQYTQRDWGKIGRGFATLPLAPMALITVPLALGFLALSRNGRQSNSGELGFALIAAAPILFPAMGIGELIKPTTAHLKTENRDALTPAGESYQQGEHTHPEMEIQGTLDKCHSIGIYFPTGVTGDVVAREGSAPYTSVSLVGRGRYYGYRLGPRYVINDQSEACQRINSLFKEYAAFPEIRKDFLAKLNQENQEAMLKSIGFI